MAGITETIAELVRWARENGEDSAAVVQDYMLEHDSRISYPEAARMAQRAEQTPGASLLPEVM